MTPPVVNTKVASALPKYLQGKRYLETDFDEEVMETTPVKSIVDPRSPNVTVQRTPILVSLRAVKKAHERDTSPDNISLTAEANSWECRKF